MKPIRPVAALVVLVLLFVFGSVCDLTAEESGQIRLLPPRTDGGKPLMQALKERKSERAFSPRELPEQVLSDLLWAAAGVNRPETGGRTAPTAKNRQEIDIYVAKAEGLYVYDPRAHALVPVLAQDIRAATGRQDFVAQAPVNLIFVSDDARMDGFAPADKGFYAATDAGFISENVYLFCASEGLATVVRGWIDKTSLAKAMKLRPGQKIILAQTVGYPKE